MSRMVTVNFTEEEFKIFSQVMVPLATSKEAIRKLSRLPEVDREVFLDALGKLSEYDHLLPEPEPDSATDFLERLLH